ncbi:MAG: hypothetical protein Kow0099_09230 [Candidatus Abyssubacteria bacterium]
MFAHYRNYLGRKDCRHLHMLSGFVSIISGILLSGTILYVLPLDGSSVTRAREVGIISHTALAGYPKGAEIRYYVAGVALALFFSLAVFLLLSFILIRRQSPGREIPAETAACHETAPLPRMGPVRWAIFILIALLVTCHNEFIYHNWVWGPWGFFFEEGMYLGWVNELLHGKALYRDTYFYSGPLMVWPQYLLMRLFGPSIVLDRVYIYFFYFIGYLIAFATLRRLVERKILIAIGVALVIYLFYPMFPGLHGACGRFTFCLIPLILLYEYLQRQRPVLLICCGTALGISLLLSQELGVAALAALIAMLLAFDFRERTALRRFPVQASLIFIGAVAPIAPVMAYFLVTNSLAAYYEAMVELTGYYSLGAWGAPFPNPLALVSAGAAVEYGALETLLVYWPILFYIGSGFFCVITCTTRRCDNRNILAFGVTVLGLVMYMRVFGVYSLVQVRKALVPLVLLSVYYLELTWVGARESLGQMRRPPARGHVLAFGMLTLFLAPGLYSFVGWRGFYPGKPPFAYRFELRNKTPAYALHMPRANGVHIPLSHGPDTESVVNYIQEHTRADEPIYVFPFAAMYYFLTDRPSATKYPAFYAVLNKTREGTIRDLERTAPRYLIYVDTGPILGLPTETRFPEITRYIEENYRDVETFGHARILMRKDSF